MRENLGPRWIWLTHASSHWILKMDSGCRCHVTVGLQQVWLAVACVDSGAAYSMLSEKFYKRMGTRKPDLTSSPVALHGAGGEDLAVAGEITVEVSLGKLNLKQVLLVGDLCGPDLLLGRDWLYDNGVELNFAERTMKIHFPNTRGSDSGRILAVVEKEVVRAGTTRRFPTTIADERLWGHDCLVEGINLTGPVRVTTCL